MLRLSVKSWKLCVAKYAAFPNGISPRGEFWCLVKTPAEVSLVCEELHLPPAAEQVSDDWRALEVEGPLDFALTGILSSITVPLADAGISIFALSTFDTDYVLVKADKLDEATGVLTAAGFIIL